MGLPAAAPAQQTGQVTGRVTDQTTLQPLATVQVYVQGTQIGVLSTATGTFTLSNVPVGRHTIIAQRLGYQTSEAEVTVSAGAPVTVSLSLAPQVLALQGIVATGLVDPVEGARSPISVAAVTRDMIPVPAAGAAVQSLQGVVAGVSMSRPSGEPGGDVKIMLRTPTSVMQSGNPLIVVDGVILSGSTTNIESMDIESMEVIRGAAAASLYGSRAASGVIAITTKRGRALPMGETQFSARTEMGTAEAILGPLPTHHYYLMDPSGTTYVDRNGNPVDRSKRVAPAPHQAFMDKAYPGGIFDNLRNVYQGGQFLSNNFSMSQNGEDTNFAVTLNRLREAGVLANNDGYTRSAVRVNLDHRLSSRLNFGISAYHSRDHSDVVNVGFRDILRAPPDVDLRQKDENGEYLRIPNALVAYENPLWVQASRDSDRHRARTLGSASLKWDPIHWLSVSANASYDREDSDTTTYVPKGTPMSLREELPSDGTLRIATGLRDTWNADAQLSLRRDFGPLNARTTVRGIVERDRLRNAVAEGSDFFVDGVPRIDAAAVRNSNSYQEEIRALGYLWDTALDYDGKYIATVLFRRDGSSLFGEDNRWHGYYRGAVAYRMAEEEWFNLPNVDELKFSYAIGTAGGRPRFSHQYETWSVGPTGVSKGTLGNRELRPEHTTEQEVSVESILFGRFGLDLTYAWQRTEHQLIRASIPAFTGYGTQWLNGGTVTGNTLELTLQAQLVQTDNFRWSSTFVSDYSRGKIEEWPFACQAPAHRLWCEGASIYALYASALVNNMDMLQRHRGGSVADRADEFQVNDDGWVVWVGKGNSFRDGMAKNLWGTSTSIAGATYQWGIPFYEQDKKGNIVRQQIADNAAVNLGWLNNFDYKGFSLHAQFQAQLGNEVIDGYHRGLAPVDLHPRMDQSGKPDELKKPMLYYQAYSGRGSNVHLEDADFLKLRTLSVRYRLSDNQMTRIGLQATGLKTMTVGLVGRNLLTLTNCLCPDPEGGLDYAERNFNNAASYPSSRALTAEVEVTF